MSTLVMILCILCLLSDIYLLYQIIRIEISGRLILKWLSQDDLRGVQYTLNSIFIPSKDNLFGLRYPTDSHYKLKKDE